MLDFVFYFSYKIGQIGLGTNAITNIDCALFAWLEIVYNAG